MRHMFPVLTHFNNKTKIPYISKTIKWNNNTKNIFSIIHQQNALKNISYKFFTLSHTTHNFTCLFYLHSNIFGFKFCPPSTVYLLKMWCLLHWKTVWRRQKRNKEHFSVVSFIHKTLIFLSMIQLQKKYTNH